MYSTSTFLRKIPIVANNSHNIKLKLFFDRYLRHYYYYISVDNKLVVFNALGITNQHILLDDNVSSILYLHSCCRYVVYMKNNAIIYSTIHDFTKIIDSYFIDYTGLMIIKSSNDFFLDSHNNLYQLIITASLKYITKISSNVVDFYCNDNHVYTIDHN